MEWVITDDIYQESWRRILEFANNDLAYDQICEVHGTPGGRSATSNYKKQASQVRVSVLQAKEYFDAACSSTIFTSANHLYYGMVSLASAMMLIRGDGSKSLDALRGKPGNKSHGLDFTTGCTSAEASVGLSILQKSHARVLRQGHFMNWYSTLPSREDAYAYVKQELSTGGIKAGRNVFGGSSMALPEEISERKYSCIDLVKHLPDLCYDLARYGVSFPFSRVDHRVEASRKNGVKSRWVLHGASSVDAMNAILDQFSAGGGWHEGFSAELSDGAAGCIVNYAHLYDEVPLITWPATRETLANEFIAYSTELDTSEFVDSYILSFQLSMLSRYFPDLWISCLESHCRSAQVIEAAVNVIRNKAPMLALSKMTFGGLVVSNHKLRVGN